MIKRGLYIFVRAALIFSLIFAPLYPQSYAANLNSTQGSKYDLASFDGFQRSLEHLDQVLSKKSTRHSLDTWRLLDQTVHAGKNSKKFNYINPQSVQFEINGEGHVLLYNGHELFHDFEFTALDAKFFGHYLVLVESEGFIKSTGIQNILFIDFSFLKSALGKTQLPVFRIPILTHQPVVSLKVNSPALKPQVLELQTQSEPTLLNQNVFKAFSEVQQVAFNMNVNLLDPKTFEGSSYLLESFTEYFDKATQLAGDSVLKQTYNTEASQEYFNQWGQSLVKSAQYQRDVIKSQLKLPINEVTEATKKFEASIAFHSTLSNISENLKNSRRMINRLALLTARLSVPRPQDSVIVIKSLAILGGGLLKANRDQMQEGFRELIHHKYFRRGTEVVAAATLAATYPVEFSQFIYQGLDISRQVAEHTWGKATDLINLGQEALTTTLKGFSPSNFAATYFSPEKLPQLLIGMGAIVSALYITLGIPHLIVNSYKLYQDLKKANWSNLKQLKTAFIARENLKQKEFLDLLSKAAAETNNTKVENLPFDKELEIKNLLVKIEEQDRSWYQNLFNKLTQSKLFDRFKGKSNHQIETFAGALRHLIFSYSSFTNAATVYTKIFNSYFSFRSFLWKPITWYTLLMYPNYIETLTSREHRETLPTELNGAFRSRHQEKILKTLTDRDAILKWENQIVELESKVYEASLRRSFRALVQYLNSNDILKSLYLQNGIKHLSDKTIEELSTKQKAFFRMYFDRLFEKSMHQLLTQLVFKNPELQLTPSELNKLSNLELKDLDINSHNPSLYNYSLDTENIQKIVDQQASNELHQEIQSTVDHRWSKTEAWRSYFYHSTLYKLSPENNPQTERLHKVNNQMKKPEAMARAVRSMMATMLVDKPMELVFLFAATAGITSGMMMPLHEEMFSADSWFHLSRYTFWNGFIFGLVMGVMSDVWSKLQQDERLDKKLNAVPEGPDVQLSYLKYEKSGI